MSAIRDNWRVLALVVLLVGSSMVLFVPGLIDTQEETAGPTNLAYGLELDGGTRVRAPVTGYAAPDVGTQDETNVSRSEIVDTVASDLGVDEDLVLVRTRRTDDGEVARSVELFTENASRTDFAAALRESGLPVEDDDVRDGVMPATRSEMVETIDRKISEAGLAGGSVRTTQGPTGTFIVVEAPNRDYDELRSLLSARGDVEIVASYPTDGGNRTNTTVLARDDLKRIGSATEDQRRGTTYVPVTLRDDVAQNFSDTMVRTGFTQAGVNRGCDWSQRNPEIGGYCLFTVVDGEIVFGASMGGDLARTMNSDEFAKDPQFRMTTGGNLSNARELQVNLKAGSLRAPLDFDDGTVYTLEPALADNFKRDSLLTGIVAVLAVSLTVFLRYGNPKVAAPMIVTALSEVFLLLGFAAAIGLPLDLSHIAGFIAVIGTGVDDLIIIADEVLDEGDVQSGRVFQSRFRKAFWVIGAAAATTIIAMSPLAVLSLGDLQGFAIITILGVLIGVLITRPAYGDILRYLTTQD